MSAAACSRWASPTGWARWSARTSDENAGQDLDHADG
jgi:hypothetical protein